MNPQYYSYTSTQADWDPVKTIFLCPPASRCQSPEDAQAYAIASGWQAIAEANKCLLIVPLAENGWDSLPSDYLTQLYNRFKNGIRAPQGKSIWGRGGTLWCWEILLYAVGYEDGAAFVSRIQIANPGLLAAAALVNGAATDFSCGESPSSHWLVPQASQDYKKRNRDIPVQAWIYTGNQDSCRELVAYLNQVNQADICREETVGALTGTLFLSSLHPAHQVRVFSGTLPSGAHLAAHIYQHCFQHVVRWKNGPDGTLALVPSRAEFYRNPANIQGRVGLNGNYYDYFLHLPAGKTRETVKGLPLVVSVHGRGEPVWMYAGKNGWEDLSDETGAFVTLTPDSPGNIWFRERDGEAFPRMIREVLDAYQLDPSRVYLTGFSNGGMMAREISLLYPQLFAATSPWNGPGMDSAAMPEQDTSRIPNCVLPGLQALADRLVREHWRMPVFMFYGDRDMGIGLEGNLLLPTYLQANGCRVLPEDSCPVGFRPDREFTAQDAYAGLPEGDRFHTYAYTNGEGLPMVYVTVMKNMPHGAIRQQSRVTWEFFRHFRRPDHGKTVIYE